MYALAAFFGNLMLIINDLLVPLIFAVAFVMFLFGVFRYFIANEEEEKRKEGRKFILWGLIGFVIMFSLWGIVNVLVNSLGFDTRTRPDLPLFGGGFGANTTGYFQAGNQAYDTNPNTIVQPGQQGCRVLGMNIGSCPAKEDCGQNGICQNIDGT